MIPVLQGVVLVFGGIACLVGMALVGWFISFDNSDPPFRHGRKFERSAIGCSWLRSAWLQKISNFLFTSLARGALVVVASIWKARKYLVAVIGFPIILPYIILREVISYQRTKLTPADLERLNSLSPSVDCWPEFPLPSFADFCRHSRRRQWPTLLSFLNWFDAFSTAIHRAEAREETAKLYDRLPNRSELTEQYVSYFFASLTQPMFDHFTHVYLNDRVSIARFNRDILTLEEVIRCFRSTREGEANLHDQCQR